MRNISQKDIEKIAVSIINNFEKKKTNIYKVDIMRLISEYLKLNIKYEKLSFDNSVQGLTAYKDTDYVYKNENEEIKIINLKKGDIIIDRMYENDFLSRRNFILAHEVAHQILYKLDLEYEKDVSYKKIVKNEKFDFNEWQANALGAALLVPKNKIELLMFRLNNNRKLISYKSIFTKKDYKIIKIFMDCFEVSMSVIVFRLKTTGYLIEKEMYEFKEDWEI